MTFVFTEYLSEEEILALSPEAQEAYIAWSLEKLQSDIDDIRDGFADIRDGFADIRDGFQAVSKRLDYFEAISAENG